VDEIKQDPGALHYTSYKQQQQQKMLNGVRPSECQYCWNVEDLPGGHTSDRYLKSADSAWAGQGMIDDIARRARAGEKINPRYVEVSFSNACNFKCGYCSPQFSSSWVNEVETHGPYTLEYNEYNDVDYLESTGQMPIHHKGYNPYVEAFWKWWPELIKDLKVFRMTGGEPLMDKNVFRVLTMLNEETPKPDLEISVNSNLGVPRKLIDRYIDLIGQLTSEKKIRRAVLYTSVDAHGAQAEYGRHGLDYDQWLENVDYILTQLPELKLTVMSTGNILSVTSYKRLLEDVYALKLKHLSDTRKMPITIDTSILRWPRHYSVSILPGEYASHMEQALEYMEQRQENENGNPPYQGFFVFEIEKVRRFVETIRQPPNNAEGIDVAMAQRDFKRFVDEHDRRRGTNFLETFPELVDFYNNKQIISKDIS
jgi:pyruvate-formate lyase-activating enzyme